MGQQGSAPMSRIPGGHIKSSQVSLFVRQNISAFRCEFLTDKLV